MSLDPEEQTARIDTIFDAVSALAELASLARGSDRHEAAKLRRWALDTRKAIWAPPPLSVEDGRRILRYADIVDLQIDAGLGDRTRSIMVYLLRRHAERQVVRPPDR